MKNIIKKTSIMDADGIRRALIRIAHEITEKNRGVENVALVGIRTRGVPLAARIAEEIQKIENVEVPVGSLDITLYRDDLTTMGYNPVIHGTEIDFDVTGKHIVLVDDVLYTGRTIRAALDAIIDMGRPNSIQLAAENCRSVPIMQEKMFRLPVVRPLKWRCRKKEKRTKLFWVKLRNKSIYVPFMLQKEAAFVL